MASRNLPTRPALHWRVLPQFPQWAVASAVAPRRDRQEGHRSTMEEALDGKKPRAWRGFKDVDSI